MAIRMFRNHGYVLLLWWVLKGIMSSRLLHASHKLKITFCSCLVLFSTRLFVWWSSTRDWPGNELVLGLLCSKHGWLFCCGNSRDFSGFFREWLRSRFVSCLQCMLLIMIEFFVSISGNMLWSLEFWHVRTQLLNSISVIIILWIRMVWISRDFRMANFVFTLYRSVIARWTYCSSTNFDVRRPIN